MILEFPNYIDSQVIDEIKSSIDKVKNTTDVYRPKKDNYTYSNREGKTLLIGDVPELKYIDDKLNDYLEEELTWNTGFKYLKPKDFLNKPSYQSLSFDENYKKKAGDFGGFCLGWCIWYVEHRLRNPKIEPKTLNEKTLEKLLRGDDSLSEFIRNYSNKLFDIKLNIVKKICPKGECIPEKNISNLDITFEDETKIINFAEEYFTYKINE